MKNPGHSASGFALEPFPVFTFSRPPAIATEPGGAVTRLSLANTSAGRAGQDGLIFLSSPDEHDASIVAT